MIELKEYRGHIRNWRNLCEELEIDNSLSRYEREREIIKKAYEKWGRDMGEHLYGMFAFYLTDGEKIFSMRDHFGTKPFYYYVTVDNKLLCGTFIKGITEQDGLTVCGTDRSASLSRIFSPALTGYRILLSGPTASS